MLELWIRDAIEAASLGWLIWSSVRNATNIRKIEIATNSMKDALVSTTRSEALQSGHAAGLAEAAAAAEIFREKEKR
jgi:hypothetical protein